MRNDDGGAMEEGGAEIGPLVQPLVGSVDRVFTETRLASLDAFRGLAIAVYLLHLLLILILIDFFFSPFPLGFIGYLLSYLEVWYSGSLGFRYRHCCLM